MTISIVNRLVENQLDFILGTKIMMQDRPECTCRKLSTSTTKAIIPKSIFQTSKEMISFNEIQDCSFITLRQKSIPKLKEDDLEHLLSVKAREKNVIRQVTLKLYLP